MSKVFYRKLGKQIKKLREEKGWTQQYLSELAGIDDKFLGNVERAARKPSMDTVIKIAKALDVEPWQMIKFDIR